MHILIIDGMNFCHRARHGFAAGDHAVTFNIFRNLRALVEMHKPEKVYWVLEGHPQSRHEAFPEYKANRLVEADSPKALELEKFFRQVNEAVTLLSKNFPVSVVRHHHHECDDTIYNVIKRYNESVQWTVASNDSDFTQLLNEFDNVKVYNPMTKTFLNCPEFDYVSWKALRGDGSDNIPGIPGIGDLTATRIVNDPDALVKLFDNIEARCIFERNHKLIKFITWSDDVANEMMCSAPLRDWGHVMTSFDAWGFRSILKEKSWNKFVSTFDLLF